MSPYETIAELTERELALVNAGAFAQLPSIQTERSVLLSGLPPVPPADARPALERAAAAQSQVTTALAQQMQAVSGELSRLGRGMSAVSGYKPPVRQRRRIECSG